MKGNNLVGIRTRYGGKISAWCVSPITDISNLLTPMDEKYLTLFNEDLSRWDVSNVVNMQSMFTLARSFNRDLSKWNVSVRLPI